MCRERDRERLRRRGDEEVKREKGEGGNKGERERGRMNTDGKIEKKEGREKGVNQG